MRHHETAAMENVVAQGRMVQRALQEGIGRIKPAR